MKASQFRAAVGVVALLAAACGDELTGSQVTTGPVTTSPVTTSPVTTSPVTTSPVGGDRDALAGTSWAAIELSDAAGDSSVPDTGGEPTLEFDQPGVTVSGSTGCNAYSGEVTIGTISIGRLAVTERGCEQAIMALEALFIEVLSGAASFTLADGVLTLEGAGGSVSFAEPAPVVDVALEGTSWSLETLVDGAAATSVVATTLPTLTVGSGSFRGTTGCNDYSGAVVADGAAFTVSDMTWTEIGCESGIMRQEALILGVLQNAGTFEIEADRLTISTSDGRSLTYRA